jgi:hypothetical protein
MVKKVLTIITILVFFASLASARTISLDNGNITFEAPDEFKPFDEEMIRTKWPSSKPPQYVIGNKSTETTIAYDLKPVNISQNDIEKFRAAFTEQFPRRIPGLKWIENKTMEFLGRKWVYLEMTSFAIDTDIYNIMIVTDYKGKMLIFNFNSTKEEFKKYERALRTSIKTIKIK